MTYIIDNMRKFMVACDQTTFDINIDQANLYAKLIAEEHQEFLDGIKNNDNVEILDALVDIVVVTAGFSLSLGYEPVFNNESRQYPNSNIEELSQALTFYCNQIQSTENPRHVIYNIITLCMEYCQVMNWNFYDAYMEVTRSNMSKVDPNTGKVIKRADGKVLKPESYSPPDLTKFV